MTDRFSNKYIAFILSDEAKVLQQQWEPNIRDTVVSSEAGKHYMMSIQIDAICEQAVLQDASGQHFGTFNDVYEIREFASERSHVAWLPTLTDLLGMIEEAGWDNWGIGRSMRRSGEPAYAMGIENTETNDDESTIESDLILAAAMLAVRVLEGKRG